MSKLRTQTIYIILVMPYEGAVQSLCKLHNCAAFEAAPGSFDANLRLGIPSSETT